MRPAQTTMTVSTGDPACGFADDAAGQPPAAAPAFAATARPVSAG